MLELIAIGGVEGELLDVLASLIGAELGQDVRIEEGIPLESGGWNPIRKQYLAPLLFSLIPKPFFPDDRALGLIDVDIFSPGFNFVFGEADMPGRRAVISLKRLRQEFYGLLTDEALFEERVLKEAVHELGHTYGLDHCHNRHCVMYFSRTIRDTDYKEQVFCTGCRGKLARKVRY